MKLMGKFDSSPENYGLYFILNAKGNIGVGLWTGKWYSLPNKIPVDVDFWWINQDENDALFDDHK